MFVGVFLQASNTKVGEGLEVSDGHPSIRQSITPDISVGTAISRTMGTFPMRPLVASQSQRKLRPSDFRKLIDKFDGTKDPYNHMANFQQ